MADDCRVPACDDFSAALRDAQQAAAAEDPSLECPADIRQLGRASWTLLHTTAALFPDAPSPAQQQAARALVQGVAELYPCTRCQADFAEEVANDGPRVESRTEFALWMCKQHNTVNRKLGQPEFECTMENLDRRWKDGDPRCWS